MPTVFLSHKTEHAAAAQALAAALGIVLPRDEIFLAEEIRKGDDWRANVDQALADAKCFVLLYTDVRLDWSWCFFEAGSFAALPPGKPRRPIYCLHPPDVPPPSPLAHLQAVRATPEDLEEWVRNALCPAVGCQRQPSTGELTAAIKQIETLIKGTSLVKERVLKPSIWIDPPWPGPGDQPNWNDVTAIANVDFASAIVSIDAESARDLGFANPPTNAKLLPFLREIASDAQWADDRVEFWISKFFESLLEGAKERLDFQEAAYFRHESGRIFRPVVVSYAKNSSGTICRLRVLFASAFVSPLTDNPSEVQRLSDGIRLAVRTRLEVVDPYRGRMSEVYRAKVLSSLPRDAIARSNPVGSRVVQALEAIWEEAMAHGLRPGGPAPRLFDDEDQHKYEALREHAVNVWERLRVTAPAEDQKGTGEYPESEGLLAELDQSLQTYLDLALPRLRVLLK